MKSFILEFAMYEIGIPVLFMNFLYFSLYFLCFRAKSSNPLSSLLTATLNRGLRNCFCFCFTSHLLFPYSFWTFIPLFSLDFYFPFLFVHFCSTRFQFFFIPFVSIFFYSIAGTFWFYSKIILFVLFFISGSKIRASSQSYQESYTCL